MGTMAMPSDVRKVSDLPRVFSFLWGYAPRFELKGS
jgi:hypothetical protein